MKTDQTMQQDVMEELRWEPILHAAEIGVAAKNGVITLTGEVANYSMKIAAEHAAERVEGVEVVVQEMNVKPIFGTEHTDEQIGQAIVRAFEWHTDVPHDKIKTKVQNGWITLEGVIDWNYQRQAAEWAVESLMGVKGVSNLISVKMHPITVDIKEKVTNAINRSAALKTREIKVETNGNKVTLKGKVRTWAERREAENAAWAAPGVMSVHDDLMVSSLW
jgi:osmotically-inducible protein OsmY